MCLVDGSELDSVAWATLLVGSRSSGVDGLGCGFVGSGDLHGCDLVFVPRCRRLGCLGSVGRGFDRLEGNVLVEERED